MNYKKLYTSVLSDSYRPITPADGNTEEEIKGAEKRLKMQLPRALRDFYSSVGRLRTIHDSHNRLKNLGSRTDKLSIDDGFLYFYSENQNVVLWCVDTAKTKLSDPPVLQENNCEPVERYEECSRVSDFLVGMMYLHLALGAGNFTGTGEADAKDVDRLTRKLEFKMKFMGLDVYASEGKVLVRESRRGVYVAGRTRSDFSELEANLKPDWSFTNLDKK